MARVEESVEINCPVDKVFAYTTDAKSWHEWQSIIPEAEQTSPDPVGVGTTFKGTVHMMGIGMNWTAEVTEYEPAGKFGKTITSAAMIIEQQNNYNPVKGRVKFTILYDIKIRGVFKLFSLVLVSSMSRELKKSLSNLKNILEAET